MFWDLDVDSDREGCASNFTPSSPDVLGPRLFKIERGYASKKQLDTQVS